MDVQVQEPRVVPGPGRVGEGTFERGACLFCRCANRRHPSWEVPQQPRSPVHAGFGEHRHHVEIVRMCLVHRAHRVGERVVPRAEVLDLGVGRIARRKCPNHRRLDRRQPRQCLCRVERCVRLAERGRLLLGLEEVPRLVVVRPDRVRETPVRHAASRIGGDGLAETLHGLLVVVPVGPPETPVEPGLRLVRGRGNGAV